MDPGAVIVAIQQLFNYALAKLAEYTSNFSNIQWLLLIGGICIVATALYAAWKSYRPMSFKASLIAAKIGLTMVVLTFAWPYASELYETAVSATGNPLYGFIAIIIGSFLGYNIAKIVLTAIMGRKK